MNSSNGVSITQTGSQVTGPADNREIAGRLGKNSITAECHGALDALSCYQNHDCKHDAAPMIESNIENREVSLLQGIVDKYLIKRMVNKDDSNDKELMQIDFETDEIAVINRLTTEINQPGIFKQCSAYLDGVAEGMRITLDNLTLCDKECQTDDQTIAGSTILPGPKKRKFEGNTEGEPSN